VGEILCEFCDCSCYDCTEILWKYIFVQKSCVFISDSNGVRFLPALTVSAGTIRFRRFGNAACDGLRSWIPFPSVQLVEQDKIVTGSRPKLVTGCGPGFHFFLSNWLSKTKS
jgi:hypothetical protein